MALHASAHCSASLQVRAALEEALSPLRAVLGGSVGENAELFELAALVSDPRAPRQPVHPDTPFKAGDGAAIVTTFVALQDVDESMGPTGFIPQTHTSEAHARFNTKDDGGRERVALLREQPNHVGILSIGGAHPKHASAHHDAPIHFPTGGDPFHWRRQPHRLAPLPLYALIACL